MLNHQSRSALKLNCCQQFLQIKPKLILIKVVSTTFEIALPLFWIIQLAALHIEHLIKHLFHYQIIFITLSAHLPDSSLPLLETKILPPGVFRYHVLAQRYRVHFQGINSPLLDQQIIYFIVFQARHRSYHLTPRYYFFIYFLVRYRLNGPKMTYACNDIFSSPHSNLLKFFKINWLFEGSILLPVKWISIMSCSLPLGQQESFRKLLIGERFRNDLVSGWSYRNSLVNVFGLMHHTLNNVLEFRILLQAGQVVTVEVVEGQAIHLILADHALIKLTLRNLLPIDIFVR